MIISRFVRVICLYLKSAADATSKSAEINTNHGSSLAAAVPDTCFSGICEGFAWFSLTTNVDPASEARRQLVTKLYHCPHVHILMVRTQDSIELLQEGDLSHCRAASLTSYFQLTTFVQRYYIQWSISIQNGTYFLIIKDISFHRLKVWQFLFPKFKH